MPLENLILTRGKQVKLVAAITGFVLFGVVCDAKLADFKPIWRFC